VLHTHAFDAAGSTPYLSITSAEPGSGKTRLLEVLNLLVRAPWMTGRTSAAALPRKIERDQPTLLLDEGDAAFKGPQEYSEALRAILNSGYRRGGNATLCVTKGKEIDVVDFSTYSQRRSPASVSCRTLSPADRFRSGSKGAAQASTSSASITNRPTGVQHRSAKGSHSGRRGTLRR
jgi:hypothetical protein